MKEMNECIVCKQKCYCEKCRSKRRGGSTKIDREKEIEIMNRQLGQFSDKMIDEAEENTKIINQWNKEECQRCLIEGRDRKMIRVLCSKCDKKECYNCLKTKYKGYKEFINDWVCDDCNPEALKPINL